MAVKIEKRQRFVGINTHLAIISWFKKHKDDSPDSLRQNKIWQTIRCYVDKMGHYKNKARGKPDANTLKEKMNLHLNS